MFFPWFNPLAFITLHSTLSCFCCCSPSPWPAKSLFSPNFRFSSSNPSSISPPPSLLPHSQQPSHFSFTLAVTYYHSFWPITPSFLLALEWPFFLPLDYLSSFFFYSSTLGCPSSLVLLFFLPLSLSIRYSTIHFFPTYSGRLYLRTVLMIKPPRKHLVCEDLISLIISVHPQGLVPIDTNIWQDKMCLIHYEWATNISVYICSVTEPAVSCTSQLVLKFWLLQKALLSSAWVFLNATPCLHQMIVALAFCSKR